MEPRYLLTSLTRIAPFGHVPFEVQPLDKNQWATGDYVVCEVLTNNRAFKFIELPNGRMSEVASGDLIVGVLGERYATLEVTGTWKIIDDQNLLNGLTSAGLFGVSTSVSPFCPTPLDLKYRGHVFLGDAKTTMRQFVPDEPTRMFKLPVILLVGTSMSAGKTTVAKIVIRSLKRARLKVVGTKISGAGRYKDILAMADAGADHILDFVDAGLPSTVCSAAEYQPVLTTMLNRMAGTEADVAVIEIGASPLEPYNGIMAYEAVKPHLRCTFLCASDPYAVYGVMKAFDLKPDLATGVATNTLAGIDLIQKLTGVRAMNLLNRDSLPALDRLLKQKLALEDLSFHDHATP